MRIALIGSAGQLGSDLLPLLPGEVIALRHHDIELGDDASVPQVLDAIAPNIVINTAAYNLVDKAEDDSQAAWQINTLGPRRLAKFCAQRDCVLVHFSTDYVFGLDRQRVAPYLEDDAPGPLGAYGLSKLGGEYAVRSLCPKHFVIRTCGLYGQAARRGAGKGNFIETMLRLGRERPELRVVSDQVCTPTSTADLATAVCELLQTTEYGLYHATNSGQMSWHELASEALKLSGISTPIAPITTEQFGAKAPRPRFSVLNCDRLARVIGKPLPDWHDALARYLRST